MAESTSPAPPAGWYDDPSGAAPYRRWDGSHWTAETLAELPSAPVPSVLPAEAAPLAPPAEAAQSAGSAPPAGAAPSAEAAPPAATLAVPAADGTLPSRRSLRQSAPREESPTDVPARVAPATAAQDPAPRFSPGTAAAPSGVEPFVAPAAWVAEAPAARPAPAEPAPLPYGARGGLPSGAYAPAWTPVSRDRNEAARWALTLPLLVLVILGVMNGAARAGAFGPTGPGIVLLAGLGIVMILMILAAVPLAIVGLVHAQHIARAGQRPRGRPHAIVGLVIVVLVGLAAGPSFGAGLVRGVHAGTASSSTTQPGSTPATVAPATIPDSGTAQDQNGSTAYVYSQALTQASIAHAIAAKTQITPNSVQCPASEPLVIGTTFDCSVALPSTGALTVRVTVTSEQGQFTLQALP